MQSLRRFVVTVPAALAVALVVANGALAEEVNAPKAAQGETASAYGAVEQAPPGARFESVLADLPAAVSGTKRGTGWLLHYGTERDNCSRPDATSGSRMMCVGW